MLTIGRKNAAIAVPYSIVGCTRRIFHDSDVFHQHSLFLLGFYNFIKSQKIFSLSSSFKVLRDTSKLSTLALTSGNANLPINHFVIVYHVEHTIQQPLSSLSHT